MARGALWTEADDATLREQAGRTWWKHGRWSALAAKLRRTPAAVRQRAVRLGLTAPHPGPKAAEQIAPRTCDYCAADFEPTHGRQAYCGRACHALARAHCPRCGRALNVRALLQGDGRCEDSYCAEGRPGVPGLEILDGEHPSFDPPASGSLADARLRRRADPWGDGTLD